MENKLTVIPIPRSHHFPSPRMPFTVTCRHPWGLGILTSGQAGTGGEGMKVWKQGVEKNGKSCFCFQLLGSKKNS